MSCMPVWGADWPSMVIVTDTHLIERESTQSKLVVG